MEQLNLFSTINVGTNLYRSRQHHPKETLFTAKDFSSPPVKLAIHPNRMSPAGISMFYCAFRRKTAQQETLYIADIEKNRMTTAVFTPKQDLFLLNFSNLPEVPSIFDNKLGRHYFSILFLHQFVSDLSGPISKNGKEHIEYVPTQIVTEYFRYTFEELTSIAIDGIIYPSSKNPGHHACVLFYDQQETFDKLDFLAKKLTKQKLKQLSILLNRKFFI